VALRAITEIGSRRSATAADAGARLRIAGTPNAASRFLAAAMELVAAKSEKSRTGARHQDIEGMKLMRIYVRASRINYEVIGNTGPWIALNAGQAARA